MGAMKPDQSSPTASVVKLRSISFSQYVGLTRFDDRVVAYTVDANIGINDINTIQIKLPYSLTTGPMGTTSGLADLSLSYTRNIINEKGHQLNATVGSKIAVGDGNKTIDGRSFPMYYQQSLGTNDLVIGLSYLTSKWLIATGAQIPVVNNNRNNFSWGPWFEAGIDSSTVRDYPTSINLNRQPDFMFRVERNWRFGKYNLSLGYLHIHRFAEDFRENPSSGFEERVGDNTGTSSGAAISLIGSFGYRFTTRSNLRLVIGRRLAKRHFNPDGLSREWVFDAGYEFRF